MKRSGPRKTAKIPTLIHRQLNVYAVAAGAAGVFLIALVLDCGLLAVAQTRTQPNPGVTFKTLYNFTGAKDGCFVYGGLARDRRGSLYGVTYENDCDHGGSGDLFKLTRTKQGYRLRVLESFSPTNRLCQSTPTLGRSGDIFGVCTGGATNDGTLWEYSAKGRFTVLHSFGGPPDGQEPEDGVVLDGAGNIYGTAYTWGPGGSGTLWKYSLSSHTFTVLHGFADGDDGGLLRSGPKIDQNGVVWGTTEVGPNCYYCGDGTVWNYDPASGTFATVLDFTSTGIIEPQTRFAIGEKGNLFGAGFTSSGNCSAIYELQKENNYSPVVVYHFTGTNGDGCDVYSRIRFDERGHLLGITYDDGAFDCGIVYKLTYKNGAWEETILHSFDGSDGCRSWGGLVTDLKGNWFGTTSQGGKYGWGTIFEISGIR
jgi:uncharacterized repeat protein (TIGR03803 family)